MCLQSLTYSYRNNSRSYGQKVSLFLHLFSFTNHAKNDVHVAHI